MKQRASYILRHAERLFILVGILGSILRISFLIHFPQTHAAEDLDIAKHLAAGEGFSIYDRGPTTAKGPVYPFFLAFFIWLGADADNLWQAALVQHLLLSWAPLLIYRLGVYIASPTIGLIAGLAFALHPSFVYYPNVLENTSIFIFLSLLWGLALFKLKKKFSWYGGAFLGVWWGIMWIEKPVAFLPMGIALLWQLQLSVLLRLLPFALLPVGVWALRGYWTFGYPTWTKTYAAQHTFAISWHPRFAATPAYTVSDSLAHYMDSIFILPEQVGGPAFAALGKSIVRQQGTAKLIQRTLLHAVIFWWIPPRYWQDDSLRFWLVRKLPVILINSLFLVGLWYGLHRHKKLTGLILLTSLLFTIFYALNHVLNIRYRLDIEWLQLYVCAMAVEGIGQSLSATRGKKLPDET
ncbi:MAG: glycosyltransferase family 39 protein [Bacteroidia bacterium]|nr:glycosyltransferase family 39 protein [Bacteroidia bacterium]MDW8416128.1 glycosyltransferase family 39 protein [Bacteroidia bacterium]